MLEYTHYMLHILYILVYSVDISELSTTAVMITTAITTNYKFALKHLF